MEGPGSSISLVTRPKGAEVLDRAALAVFANSLSEVVGTFYIFFAPPFFNQLDLFDLPSSVLT